MKEHCGVYVFHSHCVFSPLSVTCWLGVAVPSKGTSWYLNLDVGVLCVWLRVYLVFCVLFCVVVAGFRVTSGWFVFGVVFLFGFVVWACFGCDFAVDVSLVNMAECWTSVVLVVDACCVTSVFH